ncbi:MAG: phospholipid carrier-dependent glycosyltransferase [Candidatus Nomurabacteria bacterium]|nr:MAG: phospholipid carrier-dependent glycosyltransferase [Candidatus Nomurabacteria bacterium]
MKWYGKLFAYPEAWVLTVIAFVTRFWQLGQPNAVVFDEVYFRQFAANYLNGHYFFDIHPPFVKLLFAGIGTLFHLSSAQVLSGAPGSLLLRLLPALAGAALIPLVYVIIRQLGLGRRMALFGALLVLCDNALLVESRFVLMDSLLLLFGFSAFSCYLQLRKSKGIYRWMWVLATAVFLGMLVSTKWTGLAMAGLLAVTWAVEGILRRIEWHRLVIEAVAVISVVVAIYMGSFAIHFTLLNRSGDGDAFMSQRFQSTLIGNTYYRSGVTMSFWDKFVELNAEMYTAQNSLVNVTHPYASCWYSWPLEIRPIYYWEGAMMSNGQQGNIYLLGNPIVWWLSALGVISAFAVWLVRPKWLGRRWKLVAFLLAGYALNFVPFVLIERPMFLYHYLFALIFSVLATCVMLAKIFDWQRKKYGVDVAKQTYWILTIAVVLGFVYFLPLSYGWPMSVGDLQQHMWLPSWR